MNAGISPGQGEAHHADARVLLSQTPADVVFLDPPYPDTTGYANAYAVLDDLLGDQPPDTAPALDELLDASRHIPWLLLSYGGPTVTLDGLVHTVGQHRAVVEARAVPYPHLRAVASEQKNATNHEFLILARR